MQNKSSKPKDISCYFPPELWTEHILPRLPVKTLLILRSVCRSWCSAIDDPAFISMHFKLSKNNHDKNKLLATEKVGKGRQCIWKVTPCRCDTLTRCDNVLYPPDGHVCITSCNGLFLVMHRKYGNLKLWNLAIRKSLLLPPCPLATGNRFMDYLFGFKPSSNDYVLYAFLAEEYRPIENLSLAVYTLSDNLWRIRNGTMSLPSRIYETFLETMSDGESVYFGGAVYWFGNHDDNKQKTHLVSFNFDTEEFSHVELPDTKQEPPTFKLRFLFGLGESLATVSISSRSNSMWVLKNGSWDLRLLKFSNSVGFRYIFEHPRAISNCFYVEDGGITLFFENISYNIMTDKLKHLTMSLSKSVRLDTYIESLALHKRCEGQIITSL